MPFGVGYHIRPQLSIQAIISKTDIPLCHAAKLYSTVFLGLPLPPFPLNPPSVTTCSSFLLFMRCPKSVNYLFWHGYPILFVSYSLPKHNYTFHLSTAFSPFLYKPTLRSLQERQSSCGRPNPGSDNWEIVLTMQTIGPTFLRQGKIKGRFTCLKVFGYLVLDFIDQFLDQPALDVWYEYLHVRGARGVNYHDLETPYTKWYTKWYSRICIDKRVMR